MNIHLQICIATPDNVANIVSSVVIIISQWKKVDSMGGRGCTDRDEVRTVDLE